MSSGINVKGGSHLLFLWKHAIIMDSANEGSNMNKSGTTKQSPVESGGLILVYMYIK